MMTADPATTLLKDFNIPLPAIWQPPPVPPIAEPLPVDQTSQDNQQAFHELDRLECERKGQLMLTTLNPEQRVVYDAVLDSITS